MERELSSISNDVIEDHMSQTRSLCAVCGAPAIGRNFDAMTCLSCKAFFRRNAYNEHLIFTCRIKNACEITSVTRRHCSACRLRKCFHKGMKKELIRSLNAINHASSAALFNRTQYQLPGPTTVNLLPSTDRPTLSFDDWSLLTNIRNAYDQYCVQKFIESHQTIPLIPPVQPYRARIKLHRLIDLRFKYTIIVASFLERVLQFDAFHILSRHRYHYAKNSLQCIASVNTSELMKSKVLEFLPWEHDQLVVQSVLSDELIKRAETILHAFQTCLPYDPVIMKLWVIILALSSQTVPLMKKDHYSSVDFDPLPTNLFLSQNYYLTLLWKYVMHRLGHDNAVTFSVRFIQNFLRRQVFEADMTELIYSRDDHGQLIPLTQMYLRI